MCALFGERVTDDFDHLFFARRLHHEWSEFQEIEVYEHSRFGRVLVLDGFIQTTTTDEFCYHEMLVHPALCSLETVQNVLIIGGGDGGALRQVLMHKPREVVVCEIDERVIEVSRKYLPTMAADFDDARVSIRRQDAAEYVQHRDTSFGAILVDCTDRSPSAEALYSPEFFQDCAAILDKNGVLVIQSGSPFHQQADLEAVIHSLRPVLDVEVYFCLVPSYAGVMQSFVAGSRGERLKSVDQEVIDVRIASRGLETRYYTSVVHPAALALPRFLAEMVQNAVRGLAIEPILPRRDDALRSGGAM